MIAGLLGAAPRGPASEPLEAPPVARSSRLPRKVVVGTVVGGYEVYSLDLAARLQGMERTLAAMAAEAAKGPSARPLDLAVFPEYYLAHPGDQLSVKAIRLEEVQPALAAMARRFHCYVVAPMILREAGEPAAISNGAALVDRQGRLVGLYRKVHPVGGHGSDLLEGGTKPGRDFPVFDCDFGRLGIQICFDMVYDDGWRALARQGAEVVALPSASPETVHPSLYALQYGYYVVSAAPRDHSAVFSPLGLVEAQATVEGEVLVHEFDLSYEVLHWDADLDEGAGARRRFGDRIGYHYYRDQDMGIFWSNDPKTPVARMLEQMGLSPAELEVRRLGLVQDKFRGGAVEGK